MKRSVMRGIMLTAFVFARGYLGSVLALTLWVILPVIAGGHATVVMSGSMEPSVRTGDIVIAKKLARDGSINEPITPGKVILAEDPAKEGSLFTHRVISVLPDGSFITKGDANAGKDMMPVSPGKVLGIEKLKIPFLGIPVQAAKTGNFLPAVIFVLSIVGSYRLISVDNKRHRELKLASMDLSTVSRTDILRLENGAIPKPVKLAMIVVVALMVSWSGFTMITGSGASFSGSSDPARSVMTASAAFPAGKIATCDSAVYRVTGAGTSVTCELVSVKKTTKNYELTVKTSSPMPVQWSINADWNDVDDFKSAKGFGNGVSDTGNIHSRTYAFAGVTNGSTNPANSWNYKYISSTKADIVFTVQVVIK